MINGNPHRQERTRQRLIAAARKPERMPLDAVTMLLGLIIMILVLGKSGVMV